MTDLDAPATQQATPAITDRASGASAGAQTLFWGVLIAISAIVLIIAGSSSSDGDAGDTMQSAAQLGWVLGALSLPFVLIGCIAIGIRMGLRDHTRD